MVRRVGRVLLGLCVSSLVTGGLVGPSVSLAEPVAVTATGIGYAFSLAADKKLLLNPDDPLTAMMAAWQTQHDLQLARNMPFAMLENTSTAAAEIARVSLTVGDTAQVFDWVKVIESSPGVGVVVHGTDMLEGGLFGETLELELAGFGPGARLVFQLDIDPLDGSAFPLSDFRTVLFDANGDSASDNAALRVVFGSSDAAAETALETLLSDFAVAGPLDVAPGYRAYEKMDHVNVFSLRNEGLLEMDVAVPEPGTDALLALAAALCLGRRRGSRALLWQSATNETTTRLGRASSDGTERSARV